MKTKGRRVAIAAGVLALLTVGAAGIAGRERIREWWYLRALDTGDVEEKIRAAEVLGNMRSTRAVRALVRWGETDHNKFERDRFDDLADSARQALDRIGGKAVPALIDFVRSDGEDWVKAAAVRALRRLGSEAREAVPFLLDCLQGESNPLRYHAAAALYRIEPGSKGYIVPVLTEGVSRFRGKSRALGAFGILEALEDLKTDPDEKTREAAVRAFQLAESR